jgi:transketolase
MSLQLSHDCHDGNLQSVFSCLDIVWTLYDRVMRWSPELARDDNRDFFLVSKGQATLALFPVLVKKGFFKWEELAEIGSFDSKFCIQADITKFNGGVENAAGSLGHGLPMAAGIAMANKIKKSPSRVFVLTGDGEFMEGTMWESCIFASGKKLDNLCVIIDDNNSVGSIMNMGNMQEKLEAFGFEVYHVNGHNIAELEKVLSVMPQEGKPMAVIAHTVRGYGSPTMTEHDVWFHKPPSDEELDLLIKEVEAF